MNLACRSLLFRGFASLVGVLIAVLATTPTSAQTTYVLRPMPGLADQVYTPSAAYPMGAPGPGPLFLPRLGAVWTPGTPVIAGGSTCAGTLFYSTDGFWIAQDPHPSYPLFWCPGGAICFAAVPAPALLGGGVITGLAYDAAGGILWVCDAVSIQPFLPPPAIGFPPPGLTPLGPAFPVPAGAAVTGLGFEPGTGTLWACDMLGTTYNLTPAGVLLGVFPPAFAPAGLVTGLAINSTNGQPGDAAPPGCSSQVGGFHVLVTDGINVYDALTPGAAPIPAGMPIGAVGLAFNNDPQISSCSPKTNTATTFTSLPTDIGMPPPSIQLRITPGPGAPPFASPFVLIDSCPGGPYTTPWGINTCIDPASPTVVVLGGNPDPIIPGAFVATIAPSLTAGVQFSSQWVYFDPMIGGFNQTDVLTYTFGRL